MKSVWFLFNCQLASPPWVSDWREGLPVPQSGSCFIFPCLVPSLTCYRSIAMYRPSPFAGQQHPLSYQSGHLFFLLECDRSHFVVQTGVELKPKAIPLPQSSECWGYKWEPPPLTWAPYLCWGEACNERERERASHSWKFQNVSASEVKLRRHSEPLPSVAASQDQKVTGTEILGIQRRYSIYWQIMTVHLINCIKGVEWCIHEMPLKHS